MKSNSPLENKKPSEQCWNRIGVHGDSSCDSLKKYTNCINCPVYTDSTFILLNRERPEGYYQNDTEDTAIEELASANLETLYVFKLGEQVFALPNISVRRTTLPGKIHTIPKRSNEYLVGLMNSDGTLFLTYSLKNIIYRQTDSINLDKLQKKNPFIYAYNGVNAVFFADEILGLHQLPVNSNRGVEDTGTAQGLNPDFCKQSFKYYESEALLIDHEFLSNCILKKYL